MPVARRRRVVCAATQASQMSGSTSGVSDAIAIFPLASYG